MDVRAPVDAGNRAVASLGLAIAFGLVLWSAAPVAGAPGRDAWGPDYRYCGSFLAGYRIHVYAKKTSCRSARRIQREYWLAPRSRKVIVNGGSGASGYVLLKRYPRWRCGSGAGAGSCNKGRSSAAYAN